MPLFLPPLITQAHSPAIPNLSPIVIQQALKDKPTPQFPDFNSNYQNTVVIPQQAREAAQQAQAQADAQVATQSSQSVTAAPVSSGGCSDWIANAGISDFGDAMYVINIESGCNPNAINASSGACGIGQALPCSKMPCALGDGSCQVIWMNQYVLGTYGSWANAAYHERAFNWY